MIYGDEKYVKCDYAKYEFCIFMQELLRYFTQYIYIIEVYLFSHHLSNVFGYSLIYFFIIRTILVTVKKADFISGLEP